MQASDPQFMFRFDRPRESQGRMMHDIYSALSQRRSIFINAPTGVGKTDASISSCLKYAMENGKRVFFLTPKNSQHRIAVEVLCGLRKKFGLGIKYVDMVGKRNMCVNPDVNMREGEAFYMSCEKLIKGAGCRFYENSKEAQKPQEELYEAAMAGHNALFRESFDEGVCAYEISARIARESSFIIADYAHVLNPVVMKSFIRKIGHAMSDSVVIWDEAHNIMNTASSYMNMSLTASAIKRAQAELASIQHPMDLGYLLYMLDSLSESKIRGSAMGEAFVENSDIPQEVSADADKLCGQLDKAAMEYINNKGAKRSALMHISRFIRLLSSHSDSDVIIVSRQPMGIRLSISCLYPAAALAGIREAYANVFMSGTMLPIEMHKQMLGFKDALHASYPSPFPRDNRLCLLDRGVSTKYSQRTAMQYKAIADRIGAVRDNVHGNVAVFFPSFGVLNATRRHMRYPVKFAQAADMRSYQTEQMIREFKAGEDNLLFAVMGGSLSEGIDYANNVIKGIIIVGIPLERPNLELRAKIDYFDRKFNGKGNEYAYLVPGVVKAAQAAGRAIRGETDRAFILFMDMRYAWSAYKCIISDFMAIDETQDYLSKISGFMKAERASARAARSMQIE